MKTLEQWWDAKRDNLKGYLTYERLTGEESRSLVYLHDWSLTRGWGDPQTTLQTYPELYEIFRTASLAMCKQLEAMTEALTEASVRG